MTNTVYNYQSPDWAPLERAVLALGLPIDACREWSWLVEDPVGVHAYKHRGSLRTIKLTIDMDPDLAAWAVREALSLSSDTIGRWPGRASSAGGAA